MEQWELVGYRRVSFKDDKTNKQISGYTLFLERVPTDDNIEGMEAAKQFISSEYVKYSPTVGDTIQIVYNRYGKIGSIQVV